MAGTGYNTIGDLMDSMARADQQNPPDPNLVPSEIRPVTIGDIMDERVSLDPATQQWVWHDEPKDDGLSWWDEGYNAVLAGGTGITGGIEGVGALIDIIAPSVGEKIRQPGVEMTKWLTDHMDPEWQAAVNRSWLDLSGEGAAADWRSWAAGVSSMIPYIATTAGVGEVAALGLRGAAAYTGKALAKDVARKRGYMAAGAAASAGDAAAGAANVTDAYGEPVNQAALAGAAGLGAVAGAIAGPRIEGLLHGKTLARRAGSLVAGEAVEEGGTGFGAEVGSKISGHGFSWTNVAEQAVGGAAVGLAGGVPLGALAGVAGGGKEGRDAEADARESKTAEQQALLEAADEANKERLAKEQQETTMTGQAAKEMGIDPSKPSPAAGGLTPPSVSTTVTANQQDRPDIAAAINAQATAYTSAAKATASQLAAEAIQADPDVLQADIDRRQAEIDTAQEALAAPGTKHAKYKARKTIKEATAARDDAQRRLDGYNKRKADLATATSAIPSGTEGTAAEISVEDQIVNESALETLDDAELQRTLEKAGLPATDDDLANEVALEPDPTVKKSQAARAGADTKQRKKKGVAGAQPPSPEPGTKTPTAPAATGGNAEQQAIQGRTPRTRDKPPPTVKAATTPEPAPATAPAPVAAAVPDPSQQGARAVSGDPTLAPTHPPDAVVSQPEQQRPFIPTHTDKGMALPVMITEERGVRTVTYPDGFQRREPLRAHEGRYQQINDQQEGFTPAPTILEPEEMQQTKEKPKTRKQKRLAAMTPEERMEDVLANGPQPIDTVLAAIQDAFQNQKDAWQFKLVSVLRKTFSAKKDSPVTTKVINQKLRAGYQGIYDPRVGVDIAYVDLQQAESPVQAILHEATHAALVIRMRTDLDFRDKITKIMEDAREQWTLFKKQPDVSEIPEFYNEEEFITRALTDPKWADELSKLEDKHSNYSIFQRLRTRIRMEMRVPPDNSGKLFDTMLEMIPNGSLIPDGNRQAWLEQLQALGQSNPVALTLPTFRAMFRRSAATSTILGQSPDGRVREMFLWGYSIPMIAQTWGEKGRSWIDPSGNRVTVNMHDTINQFAKVLGIRDGYASKLRATASSIVDLMKNAVHSTGAKPLDDFLMNSRMWGIHADRPFDDISNTPVTHKPGGRELYDELRRQYDAITPMQRDVFKLIRDNSIGQRNGVINLLMVRRMLERTKDRAAANMLETFIFDPKRTVSITTAGINVEYQTIPTMAEIEAIVSRLALPKAKHDRLCKDLRDVHEAMGKETGPYIPLRRQGKHYAAIKSNDITKTVTSAELARMIADNKIGPNARGDMQIVSQTYHHPSGNYTVKIRHQIVEAFDSEAEANDALVELRDYFKNTLKLPIAKSTYGKSIDQTFKALGIENASINALRDEVKRQFADMGNPAGGEQASDMILTHFLESMADTSVRKQQLHAKKVAGASRDMLHVYSNYAQGYAYFAAQMKYGPELSHILNTQMKQDMDFLRSKDQFQQANDLSTLHDHIVKIDQNASVLTAKENLQPGKFLGTAWGRIPQIIGAWLLTGPGTILTNAFQVWQVSLPHLGARHGFSRTANELRKAYFDIAMPAFGENIREHGRFIGGLGRAARVAVSGQKSGLYTKSLRDPAVPMFERMIAKLPADEKTLIRELVLRKRIDFGLVADLMSLSERSSKQWQATQYMMEGAFLISQMTETMNRVVTGLASYRMNKTSQPALTKDELLDLAANDIDITQVNYSQSAKPALMQNEVMRLAGVFKTFPQHMFYIVTHNILQMMKGDAKGETPAQAKERRRVARRFVGGMFVTTMITSGLMGVVALEPIYAVFAMFAALFGDDDDPEQALRSAAQDWFIHDWMDMILKGVPYGLGVADTQRMGMPTLLNLDDIIRSVQDPNSTKSDIFAGVGEALFGAPGSVFSQVFWDAPVAFANGDMAKGLDAMTPKAFFINDAIKAYNYMHQGAVDRNNMAFVQPNDVTFGNLVTRVLGFEPPEIAEAKSERYAFLRNNASVLYDRNELIDKFGDAHLARDFATRNEIMKDIRAWNRTHRDRPISMQGLLTSVKGRKKGERAVHDYGVNAKTVGEQRLARTIEQRYD